MNIGTLINEPSWETFVCFPPLGAWDGRYLIPIKTLFFRDNAMYSEGEDGLIRIHTNKKRKLLIPPPKPSE